MSQEIHVRRSNILRQSSHRQHSRLERKQRVHRNDVAEQKSYSSQTNESKDIHRYCILNMELEVGTYECFTCSTVIEIKDVVQDRHKIKFYPTKKNAQTGKFSAPFIPHCTEKCAWYSMSKRHDASKLTILFVERYGKAYCPKPRELLYLPPSKRMSREEYTRDDVNDTEEVFHIVEDMTKRTILAPIQILNTTVDKTTLKPTTMISDVVDKYYHGDTEATVDIGIVNMESKTKHASELVDQNVVIVEENNVIHMTSNEQSSIPLSPVMKRLRTNGQFSNVNDMTDDVQDIL